MSLERVRLRADRPCPRPFEEDIAARLAELSGLRDRLRRWLEESGVQRPDAFAVVLATSEAVGNSIEHGYRYAAPGRVRVSAVIVDEQIEVIVRDAGGWQPGEVTADRGRGLMLIRRLMEDVLIDRGGGTTVTMGRRLSCPRS